MSNYNTQLQANNSSLEEIITQLNELPDVGGTDPILQDKTVTPSTSQQTVTADSGYDGLDTVTVNAMPTATQATPSITVNSSGLITATATQTAGYVAAGTKSATKQLAFQAAQTIIPGTTNQTIASGQYLTGVQTIKGDANLVASNIVSGKSIFGVVGTASAGGGGDTSAEDGLVTRTLTTYTNDRVTNIGQYAFFSYSSLTSVSFPKVTNIGQYAFRSCSSLTSVSFPKATSIGGYAFTSCTSLTSVSFPVATSIGVYAFQYCSSLTSVSFPVATYIGNYAFFSCSSLTSVSFPKVTSIGNYAFQDCRSLTSVSFPVVTSIWSHAFRSCSSLTSVSFPKVTYIGSYAFTSCTSLTSVSFPVATSIEAYAFQDCRSLTSVSFPVATYIGNYAFRSCSSLISIYLTNTSVCRLSNSNAFSNTGIWSTKGSIFVPTSLVASYKAASQWSYFSNRIFGK